MVLGEALDMTPTLRHKVLVVLAALAAVVGLIDAAMASQWDLVAVFALVLLPLVGLIVSLQWGRQAVPLRRDLAVWIRDRAALTGEPMSSVAERAVAAQRAALGEAERSHSDPSRGAAVAGGHPADPP